MPAIIELHERAPAWHSVVREALWVAAGSKINLGAYNLAMMLAALHTKFSSGKMEGGANQSSRLALGGRINIEFMIGATRMVIM